MEVLEIKARIEIGGDHTLSCLGHSGTPEPWPPCRAGVPEQGCLGDICRVSLSDPGSPRLFPVDVKWFGFWSQVGPTDQPTCWWLLNVFSHFPPRA